MFYRIIERDKHIHPVFDVDMVPSLPMTPRLAMLSERKVYHGGVFHSHDLHRV